MSDKKISLQNKEGLVETNKLYFNGYTDVTKIEMEDGSIIFATENHRFLVNTKYGQEWKRVYELEENDDVVTFTEL